MDSSIPIGIFTNIRRHSQNRDGIGRGCVSSFTSEMQVTLHNEIKQKFPLPTNSPPSGPSGSAGILGPSPHATRQATPSTQPTFTSATAFGPTGLPILTGFCYAPFGPRVEYGPEVMYTTLPLAFSTMNLQEGGDAGWYMDTGATSHLASDSGKLTTVFNKSIIQSILVGDGSSIPVTNSDHSTLRSSTRPLHLYNVLITPNIIKNLVSVRQFTKDNKCSIEFDEFGFSVKDYRTRQLLIRCDSTGDLYPFRPTTAQPTALISVSPSTWHQRLGHPGNEVLCFLVSNNYISCNNSKSMTLCHACQLGKHVCLPFSLSDTIVESCFDIIH
ncbi:ribonuclease H-like domain-containing protein [Tanacetum coccineum]